MNKRFNEAKVLRDVLAACNAGAVRLFRNTVGTAYVGVAAYLAGGAVKIEKPQRVRVGLQTGSGDLIGWHSRIITPEDVGKRVAIFTSIECKSSQGREMPHQANWREQVIAAGGIAGTVKSAGEAVQVITGWGRE